VYIKSNYSSKKEIKKLIRYHWILIFFLRKLRIMMGTFFEIDYFACLLAAAFFIACLGIARWSVKHPIPCLFFSDLSNLSVAAPSWRMTMATLPKWLQYGALGLFALAFLDLHLLISRKTPSSGMPSEGIAIYLIVDQSGSMREEVKISSSNGSAMKIPKIDLLKRITTQFVEERPNDLIGLVEFARTAHVLSPLTLDHAAIIKDLADLQVVSDKDQDGTAMGYAIFKTANIIAATRHYAQDLIGTDAPAYEIKSAIMILITDGFHAPSPLDEGKRLRNIDPVEAAQYAKEKKARLYVINVEPSLVSAEFAPQRRQMQHATQLTGGKFYLMDSSNSLDQIYADINSLEKSGLPPESSLEAISKDKQPQSYRRVSSYPIFIALGMGLLLISALLNASLFRRFP